MSMSFSDGARDVIRRALEHARRAGAAEIGTGHLLGALLADAELPARAGLAADQVTRLSEQVGRPQLAGLSAADEAALAEIGIDLAAVVGQVERELGPGPGALRGPARHRLRTPLSAQGRAALAAAGRLAAARGDRTLLPEHLLLALAAMDDEQRRAG